MASSCACCQLKFGPLRWQYDCDSCHHPVCSHCSRRILRGIGGSRVSYVCRACTNKGVLIQADCLQQAFETMDMLEQHRREKAQLCRDYDSLEAFAVQLQCALRRKSEALSEMQELATATPRFDPAMSLTLNTPQVRRVELHLPLIQSPIGDEDDGDDGWLTRKTHGSRRSLGGQSSVSRKSGENWEEVENWEDQSEKIQELYRQIETLKKQNADIRHKQEQAELGLKTQKEIHQRDFDRFVKLDMKCMKLETQYLEEQEAHNKLKEEATELRQENETLRANVHNMKAMFEAEMDESELRIRELEEGGRGWFTGPKARPRAGVGRPKSESFSCRTEA